MIVLYSCGELLVVRGEVLEVVVIVAHSSDIYVHTHTNYRFTYGHACVLCMDIPII